MNGRIQRAIARVSQLNYTTARSYYLYRLKKTDGRFDKGPIVVYQMGKVGSSTISKSLHETVSDRNIYHVHFLSADRVVEYERKRKRFLRTRYVGDLRHIWQYVHLRQCLHERPDEGWKVITLVRDPVARNLATFFEHMEVKESSANSWRLVSREFGFDVRIGADDLDPLIDLFFRKCRHEAPIDYFDTEFNGVLGIDLFKSPFPRERGYDILNSGKHEVLVLRLESLSACHEQAMLDFLGLRNFELTNANIGENKDYADVYRLFKDRIKLPESYLDRLYDSRMARHFYSDEELAKFRKRWTG